MAGKELKATEKTVFKHSREGVLEQNLADGTAKKVSKKAEEAVLKVATADDERFDKLKAAGLVVEDVKKPDKRKLQFGRNNPENTWAESVYGNKPTEQTSFVCDEHYQNSETSVPVTQRELAELEHSKLGSESITPKAQRKFSFKPDENYQLSETSVAVTAEEFAEMVQTSIKDEELKPKSKLSFKSEDEYVNSEESVEIDGAEFVGQKAEEKAESKLKEKKTRNGLKQKSSAAEKLTDKDGNSILCFDVNAATDRKLTHGEKKLKRRIRKDEKRVFKLQKRLDKAEDNLPHVGWNEYNYYIDPIGHDPYALISYLTAMEINFDYDADTQARIQELFNALYTLEVESVHEVRSYQYTTTDEEGNEVIVTVYYDYYILNVTLTANDWDSVVIPKLRAAGVYEVYQLLQETQGNKPDLF